MFVAMTNTIPRVRFAPSPTGLLHVGNARTALYNWLFARRTGGLFLLRIEDTDLDRSEARYETQLIEDLHWLGLEWDGGPGADDEPDTGDHGPYRQSERLPIYAEHTERLLAEGKAYRCFCTPEELEAERAQAAAEHGAQVYSGRCRNLSASQIEQNLAAGKHFAVRLRIENHPLRFHDIVRGDVVFAAETVSDPVLVRSASGVSAGVPVYNYVVTIDDALMGITHVIRGDDHVNNTPRQINILRALGGEPPVYAHLPTVLNEQGEKMSKRHGAMSVMAYRDAGYLPEAVVNYLARLGWSHGDAEIFSREQFVEWFDLEHLGKSPAQYDHNKLNWLNAHYIKEADNARLAALAKPFLAALAIDDAALAAGPALEAVIALMKDRATTVKEIAEGAAMFYRVPAPDADALAQHVTDAVRPALADLAAALKAADWTKDAISAALKATLAAHKLKMPQLAMPVRLLVAGTTHTPSIDAVLALFDRDVVVSRIETALA